MTVSDNEIVAAMREADDPAFTTSEVAEMVGLSTEGARGRLDELEQKNGVYRKKPSSRTVIWWVEADHGPSAFSE